MEMVADESVAACLGFGQHFHFDSVFRNLSLPLDNDFSSSSAIFHIVAYQDGNKYTDRTGSRTSRLGIMWVVVTSVSLSAVAYATMPFVFGTMLKVVYSVI